jgi:hypothetical protein
MSTKPNATEIAFILDRSGSMQPHTEAAISGFNQFLQDQQKGELENEGIARLTLVLFDNEYLVPIKNLPVSEVVELDTTTYVPRAATALLDAIGLTIESFRKRIKKLQKKERPAKVIFAIFTDGMENSSLKYTWIDIATMIRKRREKDGWEFLFLAANQDAIATAAQMNIHAHDSATAHDSDTGVRSSQRAMSRKIRAMRASSQADYSGAPPEDLAKPMADLLHEEEGRDDDA